MLKIMPGVMFLFAVIAGIAAAPHPVQGQDQTEDDQVFLEEEFSDDQIFFEQEVDDGEVFFEEAVDDDQVYFEEEQSGYFADLDFALEAELDDYTGEMEVEIDLQTLHDIFMYELGDEGDDASEQAYSFYDLELAMEQAGTTLDEVVWEALDEADALAALQSNPTWSSDVLGFFFPVALALDKNNYSTYRTSKPKVKSGVLTRYRPTR